MTRYAYTTRNRLGKKIEGSAEAHSTALLADELQSRGLVVLSIREANGAAPRADGHAGNGVGGRGSAWFRQRIKLADLVAFTTQLGVMLEAGIPLLRVLEGLAREAKNVRFRGMIEQVRQEVKKGSTFADALAGQSAFNRLYVNLVRAGEESGKLGVILDQLALHLEKAANLRRKTKAVITYPLFVTSFAVVVVLAMILKIVPIFQATYERFHAKLPAPTQMLIDVSDAFRSHFPLAALLAAAVTIPGFWLLRTERGRYGLDKLLLKLPLFGPIIHKVTLVRTCRTLAILVASGVPFLETLRLASQTSGNRVIEKAVLHSIEGIRNGSSIAESFRAEGVFPETLIQLIYSGEEAGALEKMLAKGADFYEQQVEASTTALTSILEPLLIILVGAVVGIMLICLFLPIFNLGTAIRGAKF